MTKREQLIEYIVQDIILYIVEDEKVDYEIAMKEFYLSHTFEHLQDQDTGLYLQGSAYIYDMYKEEIGKERDEV